jgi:hypothetical protein
MVSSQRDPFEIAALTRQHNTGLSPNRGASLIRVRPAKSAYLNTQPSRGERVTPERPQGR